MPALVFPALQVLSRELPVLRVSILAISILRIPSSAYPFVTRTLPTRNIPPTHAPLPPYPSSQMARYPEPIILLRLKLSGSSDRSQRWPLASLPPNTHSHITITPSPVPSRFRIWQRPQLASYLAEHFMNRAGRWYNGIALLFQASTAQLS